MGGHVLGGAQVPVVPPESWTNDASIPSRPSQPISPDAAFPSPCTKVQGSLPAHGSPVEKFGVQSGDNVTPSASNKVPPQVLAATPRMHPHASEIGMGQYQADAALTTMGVRPLRSFPTVKTCCDARHAPFGQSASEAHGS